MNTIGQERLQKADFHLSMARAMLSALSCEDGQNTYGMTEVQRENVRHSQVRVSEAMEQLTMLYSSHEPS